MKKAGLIAGVLLCVNNAWANTVVDLHGVEGPLADKILRRYSRDLGVDMERMFQNAMASMETGSKKPVMKKSLHSQEYYIDHIKQDGDFDFVDFQVIVYPDNKTIYTTIDVVAKNQPQRMRFVTPPKAVVAKAATAASHDIIARRLAFNEQEIKLIQSNEIDLNDTDCPVFHCVTTFRHPKLKPWLGEFNTAAVKQRSLILKTLRSDPDPERRAAAALMVGHFRNADDLFRVLTPAVSDPDDGVRNNAMRVILTTMMKTKKSNVSIAPFLDMLNSPYVTDRNKALWIILQAAGSPAVNQEIITKGKDNLISLLRLKQPNNHEVAWSILKKISNKNYGEYDIAAWQNWIDSAQTA